MKITIDIDCTPEEARSFFGLPDLSPVHDVMIERMREMATTGLKPEDFQSIMKNWMPGMSQGLQDLQKAFWDAATSASKGGKSGG